LLENVLEVKRSSYPVKSWYKSAFRTKLKLQCYAAAEKKEHAFATYVLLHRSSAPIRCEHIRFALSGRTIGEVRKAPSTTPSYVRTIRTLIELLELPGGWNSYNARPIRKENVTFAVDLLARLMREDTPAPHVVPKVRGGVQLEWHTRGLNVEIDIESPKDVCFFAEDLSKAQEPLQEEHLDENVLSQWIERLSD
jgi:hypothetical protein